MSSIFDLEREVRGLRKAKRKASRYRNLQTERARLIGEIGGPRTPKRSFAGFLAGGIKSAARSANKARKSKRGKKAYSYMQDLARQNQW